jgi:hypothetical protein
MQRFVLTQNIDRARLLLAAEQDPHAREMLISMIRKWENELILLTAERWGAASGPGPDRLGLGHASNAAEAAQWVTREFGAFTGPALLLHPGPGLRIIHLNAAFAAATLSDPAKISGDRLFHAFPDNPDNPEADGVRHLHGSLTRVAQTGRPHVLEAQRYDIRDAEGRFLRRWWRMRNSPILSEKGPLLYILHEVQDVTDEVLDAQSRPGAAEEGDRPRPN